MSQLIPIETIAGKILFIRGEKVMLDRHLAELYGVPTMRLNEAVKRNKRRFPSDFMFQLTVEENKILISQIAISKGRGGYRKLPFVFTEQGVAMLSSVLHSERAIDVNVAIMRAFVKIREILSTHKGLAQKLLELERKYESHDYQIRAVFNAIRQLMAPEKKKKYKAGF
ncbi:MAG: ORF6N domain-containing protein [Ignavibacteriales bacterium]|nr:ORF6N domain-containing protein [Ignavibacteriales bacterium]